MTAQPGDPTKAVLAIRALAEAAEPPLRLPLGSDCVRLIEQKATALSNDLAAARVSAPATDFATA